MWLNILSRKKKKTTFEEAMRVAQEYSVFSPKDSVVLYSISYLPTKKNKEDAFKYVKNNSGRMLIDNTECGKKLIELGLDDGTSGLSTDDIPKIWKVASRRFIEEASGEIVAFVKDVDPRSVFMTQELPIAIKNINITKINGMNKLDYIRYIAKQEKAP